MTVELPFSSRWIRKFHLRSQSEVRLVCFPHAGGSASFYFPMSRALSNSIEVLAVQYPGREDRRTEPCAGSIAELADCVTEVLRDTAGPPLALFGHSMGAVTAFEVARRLGRETNTGITRLFVSGSRAPSRPHETQTPRDDQEILAELKTLNGTDDRILGDKDIMQMSLTSLRGDYQALDSYHYTEHTKLSCPISMLVGASDPRVTLDDALAWRTHTTAAFDHRIFTGGHFYLTRQRFRVTEFICDRLGLSSDTGVRDDE